MLALPCLIAEKVFGFLESALWRYLNTRYELGELAYKGGR